LRGRGLSFLVATAVAGCAPHRAPSSPAQSTSSASSKHVTTLEGPAPTLETLFAGRPDVVLTLHPPSLARDSVYGPLLRRASELASAYAGPTTLGTTALAVLERTEEIVVAESDHGKSAVVVLRGVPADVDPLEIVDTAGQPVWHPVRGDVRTASRELEPAEKTDAALFVVSGLMWVVASGPIIPKARALLLEGTTKGAFVGDETPLVSLSLPGDALPQLRKGALATVGASLLRTNVALTAGSQGLVIAKFAYPDAAAAASAEGTLLAVTLAFRHRLEEAVQRAESHDPEPKPAASQGGGLNWLGAAKVDREGPLVLVRAPLPRPWLEALEHADVPEPGHAP
jgi:hypothetical protein